MSAIAGGSDTVASTAQPNERGTDATHRTSRRAKIEATSAGDEWRVVVEGACTFLALPRLTRVLASIPERTTVAAHLLVSYLDHAAHQAINDWQQQHRATGGTVRIHGVTEVGRLTSTCEVPEAG